MMIWMIILGVIALAVIAGLAWYAWQLSAKVKQQQALIAQAQHARITRLQESIETIAKAMKTGDCNHSEGVIRLAMLLMPLGKNLQTYPAMTELHEVVRDMPTHDARKLLEKKARMRLDLERESMEAKCEQAILLELDQLLDDVKNVGNLNV